MCSLPHMENFTIIQKSKFCNIQKCNSCSYMSRSPLFMRTHLERHLSSELFNCYDKNLPIYQCKKDCNFKTNLTVFLKQHLRDFHKVRLKCYECPSNSKMEEYICPRCSFRTHSLLQRLRHSKKKCQKETQPSIPKKILPPLVKWHHCDQCSFKTKRKCYLKTHSQLRHSSNENIQFFQCSHCDFQTKWKIGLRKHTLYKHTAPDAVKWYYCDQCSYKAKTNYDLSDHRMWKHMSADEVIWFQCTHCPYKAKKKSKLKQHQGTQHVDAKDINWEECDECGFKTKAKSNLRAHKATKHNKDITWFMCEHCPYKGRYRKKWEHHLVTRHGVTIGVGNLI